MIDLVAVIPVSFILQTGNYNSLARIARFPKLYRLIKISRYLLLTIHYLRLVKMVKIAKEKSKLIKFLHEKLRISVGFERLLFFILLFTVLCHIVACLWYAKLFERTL